MYFHEINITQIEKAHFIPLHTLKNQKPRNYILDICIRDHLLTKTNTSYVIFTSKRSRCY